MKLIRFALLSLAFVLSGTAFGQSNLPACIESDVSRWSNCTGQVTKSDNIYSGAFLNGKRNGQGTLTFTNGDKYVGEFKDGQYNGQGTYTLANGNKYFGEFKVGKYNGQGTLTFTSGEKYVGEFKNNRPNGQGTFTSANGEKYVGEFKDGEYNGQGTLTSANGDKYVGEFKDGKRNGQGSLTFSQGVKYVGEFKNNQPNGQGIFFSADGGIAVGEWIDGRSHGQFIQYRADKTIERSGIFEGGKLVTSQYVDPNSFKRIASNSTSVVFNEVRRLESEENKSIINANDICTRLQKSIVLGEIAVLAKKISTQHNLPYKLETNDRFFGQWLYSSVSRPVHLSFNREEINKIILRQNSIEEQINQCALSLEGSDLLYLMGNSRLEIEWLNENIREYNKKITSKTVRRIDSSGNITLETIRTKPDNLPYIVGKGRGDGSITATWDYSPEFGHGYGAIKLDKTFWIPMWAITLDPTGKITNEKFREIKINLETELSKLDVAKKQLDADIEKERQTATARQIATDKNTKESEARLKAFEESPEGKLTISYQRFQIIQSCYDSRKGYAVKFVNDVEFAESKRKIKDIENKLKPLIKLKTVDNVWNDAIIRNRSGGFLADETIKNNARNDFSATIKNCDSVQSQLNSIFNIIVGREAPKKNF